MCVLVIVRGRVVRFRARVFATPRRVEWRREPLVRRSTYLVLSKRRLGVVTAREVGHGRGITGCFLLFEELHLAHQIVILVALRQHDVTVRLVDIVRHPETVGRGSRLRWAWGLLRVYLRVDTGGDATGSDVGVEHERLRVLRRGHVLRLSVVWERAEGHLGGPVSDHVSFDGVHGGIDFRRGNELVDEAPTADLKNTKAKTLIVAHET